MQQYTLPNLQYSYDALEPVFTGEMMELHHSKHHGAYVNKLNELLQILNYSAPKDINDFIGSYSNVPEKYRDLIRFYGGGHANHTFFWNILKPYEQDNDDLPEDLGTLIDNNFGTLHIFKKRFTEVAMGHLGSGWVWLNISADNSKTLFISATLNHDNPQMIEYKKTEFFGLPILTLDLWEHAYYLKYKNCKADYCKAFWKIIKWEAVAERYRQIVEKL
ncbi:MAG: superoxide dismutase [Puniceicoccales bacterium]|jgi:Fe-Mn family superoxide dismutase|nr:superoxide dismutase [Puniceicoccales bacterium]